MKLRNHPLETVPLGSGTLSTEVNLACGDCLDGLKRKGTPRSSESVLLSLLPSSPVAFAFIANY